MTSQFAADSPQLRQAYLSQPTPVVELGRVEEFLRDTVELVPIRPEAADLRRTIADYRRGGLPQGTAVAIGLSNGVHLLTHYFALLFSGLVPLLVSPSTPSSRILELGRHLDLGGFVAAKPDPERLRATHTHRVGAQLLVHLGGSDGATPSPYEVGDVLMLTSGTSGMYSGCVHRFESLPRNASRHAVAIGLRPADVMLVILPLYYSYALVAQAFAALVTGARLVIGGPPFVAPDYRRTIDGTGVTVSSITPAIARQLLHQGIPLPAGLRTLTVGGDHLEPGGVGDLWALHRERELFLTYGLTEAGPRVSTLDVHAQPAARWSSVGLPLDGVAVALRDVRADGVGELLVRSDTVLRRKVGVSVRQPCTAPLTIATGDLFSIDEDGYLFFHGRQSDFAVVNGEKVSLRSMRQAAQSVAGVLRAEPVVCQGPDGVVLDLVVDVLDPEVTTRDVVVAHLNALLLRSERPRAVSVRRAEFATFRK